MSDKAKHEQAITDETTPNDATINDNLCVTKTISIGVCSTDAKLSISDPSFRGKMKLLTTSGTGHDFGYDGGIDNFFAFAHIGLESGQTKFVWHPNENSTRDLLTIKNTGNIGIGISEPQNRLHVVAPGGFPNNVPIVAQSVSTFFGARDAAGNERFAINLDSDGTSYPVNFYDKYDGKWRHSISLKLGNVGIGTTKPEAKLHISDPSRGNIKLLTTSGEGQADFNYDGGVDSLFWFNHYGKESGDTRFLWSDGTRTTDLLALKNTGKVGIGTTTPSEKLEVAGNVKCVKLMETSSRELKENIAELSGQEAVNTLQNLNPVKFNYKADSEKNQYIGFIAEDVPELVATSDRKGLSSMDIVAVLTKALQEQQKTIAALADKVNMLESQTA
ncbi:MAG: tail fiber domain-containing protein [Potamolinea sp.]